MITDQDRSMSRQKLYVPSDIDMVELAMEIDGQFSESDEIHVFYEDSRVEYDIEAGDLLGVFTLEGLRKQGFIS